jgi:hypothetical protein
MRLATGHGDRLTDIGRWRDEDVVDRPVRWGVLGTGGIASTFVTDLRLTESGVAVAVGERYCSVVRRGFESAVDCQTFDEGVDLAGGRD